MSQIRQCTWCTPNWCHSQRALAPLIGGLVLIGAASLASAGIRCPQCAKYCKLSIEDSEESRHCWTIECEDVCVPRVVFPWQNRKHHRCNKNGCTGCATDHCQCCVRHNGAFVVRVRKLKKHKYTCPRCDYVWEVKHVGCTDASAETDDEQSKDKHKGEPTSSDAESSAGDKPATPPSPEELPALNEAQVEAPQPSPSPRPSVRSRRRPNGTRFDAD